MRIREIVGCFIFLSVTLILPFSARADKPNQENSKMDAARFSERVIAAVKDAESRLGCRIGLSFIDKDLDLSVGYHEWDLFHAASTMKVPVMIEVFRQAEQGKFSMKDTILVDPVFHSMIDDSTFECDGYAYINSRKGQPETILKLTEQMIVISDNLATNLLITRCNARKITATARQLGATKTLVLRCVMDIPAYEAGLSNRVSAGDLTRLFEAIELYQAASPASCQEMKKILLAQEHNSMIPAKTT